MPDWLKDIGVFIATYTAVRVIIIVVEAMRRCDLGGVVKRVCSRSSLPGVGQWPGMTPLSWHNGSPLRATA